MLVVADLFDRLNKADSKEWFFLCAICEWLRSSGKAEMWVLRSSLLVCT